MNCSYCGAKIRDGAKYCQDCGARITTEDVITSYNSIEYTESPREGTNGLCIAGFVLGIVSLMTCSLFISILGIILSAVGMKKSNTNHQNGRGLGIAGLVTSLVYPALSLLLFLFLGSLYNAIW